MKFFMPVWEDRLDANFDFQADSFSPSRDMSKDVYAHELFPSPLYDGLLVSRAIVEQSKTDSDLLSKLGAAKYFRLDKQLEIFGDCGAYSYVNEEKPWYDVEDVLDYYASIGVHYGASVDHLVVKTIIGTEQVEEYLPDGNTRIKNIPKARDLTEDEKRTRMEITLQNASSFINLHKSRGYSFIPVGVAQGSTAAEYAHSVMSLLKMGYTYIALGGLARSSAQQVLDVLSSVNQIIEDYPYHSANQVLFHLFGVGKLTQVEKYPSYRVASIDSASYLRKAWLRSDCNYLGVDGKWYSAVRVPQSDGKKVRDYVSQNGRIYEEVQQQERYILKLLQDYSDRKLPNTDFEHMLTEIVNYDQYLLRNEKVDKEAYRSTLEARPWEQCSCGICKQLGVHVVIFRGTNRNKRRGFHNTWVFYQKVKGLTIPRI